MEVVEIGVYRFLVKNRINNNVVFVGKEGTKGNEDSCVARQQSLKRTCLLCLEIVVLRWLWLCGGD